jgi:hypothetical protein
MDLYGLYVHMCSCPAVQPCAAMRQYVAVCLVVYASTHGIVQLSNCAAVRDSVQQCASVRGATACGTMRLKVYVNTCGSVGLCSSSATVCGIVRYCARGMCGSHAACSTVCGVQH